LVKSGTPEDIIVRVNGAVSDVLKTEAVRTALTKIGTYVGGGTPEDFGNLEHAERCIGPP
jgi:tripartite-type tricarboxylate transporter receptor subunit TctC